MSTSTYPSPYSTDSYPKGSYPASKSDKDNLSILDKLCIGLSENKNYSPHGFKVKYLINFYKATTALFILSLMSHYKNYSLGSFLYLALHGVYGLVWLMKDMSFPDHSFEKKVGFFGTIVHSFVLSGYWVLPWIQISGHGISNPSAERVLFTIMLFTIGICMMIAADSQKTFTLRDRPGLIKDGMFKYTRNPNYLGEMMVYSSFAFLTGSLLAWGILISLWVVFFIPRMIAKDVSLRGKEGSTEYFRTSSMLLPKLFSENIFVHYAAWLMIFGAIFWIGEWVSLTHFIKSFHPLKYLIHRFL